MTETPEAIPASEVQVRVVEMEPLLLTVPKAAELIGLSDRSVYDLIYTGEIESVHVGPKKGRHNVTYRALQDYVERCREEDRLLGYGTDSPAAPMTGTPRRVA